MRAYFAERRWGYANERTVAASGRCSATCGLGAAPVAVATSPATASRAAARQLQDLPHHRAGACRVHGRANARLLRPFLDERAAGQEGRLELKALTAGDVASFVVDQSVRRSRSVKRIVSALRSFLGFLYVEGLISQPLAQAVPSPPGWTLTGLPKTLPDSEVAALLASCDAERPAGRRDLAILTLLARLGLRAGEVAALRLDDIDWRRGELVVRGKAGRVDRLPLPADVGEKIAAYLRDGRPESAECRAVFITALAPHGPLSPGGVTTVVAAAGAGRARHDPRPSPSPLGGDGNARAGGRCARSATSCGIAVP